MRLLLLVNASASSVTARARVVIQKALSADHEVTMAETSRRGHASRLARGAAVDGADAVVVLGGDGTLNEAANGLAGSDTALGVLPGGSTNVFARTIGMINDPIEATSELLSALAQGSIRRVGLGSVNGRYFLFHVGLGFDAAVVEQVERRGALKRFAGHPLFVYSGVATWLHYYDRSRPRFAIHTGPTRHGGPGLIVDDGYFAVCLNTNPYTFLGNRPLDVAPEASFDTGLSLMVLRTLSLVPLLRVIGASLRGKGGARLAQSQRRKVAFVSDIDQGRVSGFGPFPYQVDGDFLGQAEALELRYEPDALSLVVPAAAPGAS